MLSCVPCSWQLRIRATDNRKPEKVVNATVIVTITRDESKPVFSDTPYADARVSENAPVGREFYTKVQALDRDLRGSMKYAVIGDMPAPTFFAINQDNGHLVVKSNLKADDETKYTVRNEGPVNLI